MNDFSRITTKEKYLSYLQDSVNYLWRLVRFFGVLTGAGMVSVYLLVCTALVSPWWWIAVAIESVGVILGVLLVIGWIKSVFLIKGLMYRIEEGRSPVPYWYVFDENGKRVGCDEV
jgi:hypothetical protein